VKPRGVWIPVLSVVAAVGLSSVAAAKGSGIYFEKRYHAVGTTSAGWATVEFDSPEAAGHARRTMDLWVYMRPAGEAREPVRVGRVELHPRSHPEPYLDARVIFEVPEGASGRQVVMICRLGCQHPLDVPPPTPITVVSGPVEARLNRAVDRLATNARAEVARRNFYTGLWSSSLERRIIYDSRIKDYERTESIQAELQKVRGRLAAVDGKDHSVAPWLVVGVVVAAWAVLARRRRRFPNFAR